MSVTLLGTQALTEGSYDFISGRPCVRSKNRLIGFLIISIKLRVLKSKYVTEPDFSHAKCLPYLGKKYLNWPKMKLWSFVEKNVGYYGPLSCYEHHISGKNPVVKKKYL